MAEHIITEGSAASSAAYAADTDINIIFGTNNVAKWADVDGDDDATKKAARVAWGLALSQAWLNDRLRNGPWTIPFITVPALIKDLCARNAGVLIYDARRVTDEGAEADEVSFHRRYVETQLNQILAGQIKFDLTHDCINYPKAIDIT